MGKRSTFERREDLALDPAFVPPLRSGIEPVPVSTKGFNRGEPPSA
jgi:hypothetical protein